MPYITHFTLADGGWIFELGSCPWCNRAAVRGSLRRLQGSTPDSLIKQGLTLMEEFPPCLVDSEFFGDHRVCTRCDALARELQVEGSGSLPDTSASLTEEQGNFNASEAVAVLEGAWAAVRGQFLEVPAAVVVLASGTESLKIPRYGHWAASRWRVNEDGDMRGEVLIAGEALDEGASQVLGTLLHEAAHALAHARGIKDTSRQGRYHNRAFKKIAEELGLEVSQRPPHGFCDTILPPNARRLRWSEPYQALEKLCMRGSRPPRPTPRRASPKVLPKSASGMATQAHTSGLAATADVVAEPAPRRTNGVRATLTCCCVPPRRILVVPSIAELGTILCGICDYDFVSSGA